MRCQLILCLIVWNVALAYNNVRSSTQVVTKGFSIVGGAIRDDPNYDNTGIGDDDDDDDDDDGGVIYEGDITSPGIPLVIDNIKLTRDQITMPFVMKNITENFALTSLVLRGCYLEPDAASECLKTAISNDLPHLSNVVLSQIGLDDHAFKTAVIRNVSMPLSNQLHCLDLSHNPLTEKSIKHLASIVARIPGLQQLKLDGMVSISSFECIYHIYL